MKLKVKVWIETYPVTGKKRFANIWAEVERLPNGKYKVESVDGDYKSNCDVLKDGVFYTT